MGDVIQQPSNERTNDNHCSGDSDGSASHSNTDHNNNDTEENESDMHRLFRYLHPSDRDSLLEFFREHGVTDVEGLQIFDPCTLWEMRADCELLQQEEFCTRLGDLCHSFAIGYNVLAEWPAHEFEDFICGDLIHENIRSYYQHRIDPSYRLAVPPEDISDNDKLSYFIARTLLEDWFHDAPSIEIVQQDAETRKEWLRKGVVPLLERYPLLAANTYSVRAMSLVCGDLYPCDFFLFGGFHLDVVRQVHVCYPEVSEDCFESQLLGILRLLQDRQTTIPIQVFRNVLKMAPKLTDKKNPTFGHSGSLLEFLLSLGYGAEVLEYVRAYFSKDKEDFYVTRRVPWQNNLTELASWELDLGKVKVIEDVLPQLLQVQFDNIQWTPEAFVHLCRHLTTCQQIRLRIIHMHLPPDMAGSIEDSNKALECFIQNKGVHPKELSFHGTKGLGFPLTPTAGSLITETARLTDGYFKAIARGLQRIKGDWNLDEMNLSDFRTSSPAAVAALFSTDIIGSLSVQHGRRKYKTEWESTGRDGVRIERMNLFDVQADIQTWISIWDSISRLTRVENFVFVPGETDIHRLEAGPFNALLCMPSLQSICIGPHPNNDSLDITACLVALLGRGCLDFLQIEGSYEHDDYTYGCHAYTVNTESLCQALKNDSTLSFLFLRGVKLEGTQVTKSFLEVLQNHNNTTIEFADICDGHHFFSIIPKDSWRREPEHAFNYESYPHAWQLYFLTCFNRFGRGKVQDKSTTVADLVKLLVAVHPNVNLETTEKAAFPDILKSATLAAGESGGDSGSSNQQLDALYCLLQRNPKEWYNIVKRDNEALSLQYGLLRETPCLWCLGASRGAATGRKRKYSG